MTSEQPFKITVTDDALSLLKRKLDDTRLPDEVNAAGWDYGVPLGDIRRLVGRWKDGYDWRTHERELNALPMFTRAIAVEGFGELRVHYVHQRSTIEGAIPLLFVHGWPGSFLEATKVLPLLTAGSADHPAFHVVAPSLPGYAWSEGVLEKGFVVDNYAELFNKLMLSLGYTEYVTQGGDWGHALTLSTASKYGPKHVKACLSNMPICDRPKLLENPITILKCLITSFTSRNQEAAAATRKFLKTGTGNIAIQSTKPQTLGYSLADSPVGLLAWIYEKLVTCVLTWVSIYWFSLAGPAASIRIYYEFAHADKRARFPKTSVPIGLSFFPKELLHLPRALLRAQGKIVFESEHEVGGHFAAYEQPEALVGDLRKMFAKSGPAAGVVPGCSGY
ncbi:Alpha/Beta hydrolase protein [Lactarius quietus]|nr:Alpha/Beta hydrolase protein [Lactarius quietus]